MLRPFPVPSRTSKGLLAGGLDVRGFVVRGDIERSRRASACITWRPRPPRVVRHPPVTNTLDVSLRGMRSYCIEYWIRLNH